MKIPKGFENLLGQKYWQQASETQLWGWMEVLSFAWLTNMTLRQAINHCGSEDCLLEGNSCLAMKAKAKQVNWLVIFGYEEKATRKQGQLTDRDNLNLAVWCANRLHALKEEEAKVSP
ncbi:MAG: hypothetical protein AB4352_21200 [Hormoscilla sp.]